MASEFKLSDASPADAAGIASVFAISWTSPFAHLKFGKLNFTTLGQRIAQLMTQPGALFVVVRDPVSEKVVAVAQWTTPEEENAAPEKEESEEQKVERQQFEDEAYKNRLPETSNKDLVMEATIGLRDLRESVLQGQKHYALENLATHPDYRGKRLASDLVKWVFPQADEQGVVVYLDTAIDNPAMGLYKKLGFVEKESSTIEDLGKYGGEGSHTHVAFLRYPRKEA